MKWLKGIEAAGFAAMAASMTARAEPWGVRSGVEYVTGSKSFGFRCWVLHFRGLKPKC